MNSIGAKVTAIGVGLVGIVAGVLITASAPALAAASLPDGRAWEMVSPLEKNGGEINGIDGAVPDSGLPEGGIVQASTDGSSITYLSLLAFPATNGKEPLGAPIASQYLSTRNAREWSVDNITVAVNSNTYPVAGNGAPYEAFSSDLSKALMLNGETPVENPPPPLAPGSLPPPPRYQNLYLWNAPTGDFSALLTSAPSLRPTEFLFALQGVTPDLGHAVILSNAALTPEATAQERGNLYEWAYGQFQPVNVPPGATRPGETSAGGAVLGMGSDENRTISSDGTRVIWSQEHDFLFVRKGIGTPQATTLEVDKSQEGPDPSGFGVFRTASANDSRVFFTDPRRLTPNSTAGGIAAHEDLYMFDVDTSQLTDITIDGTDSGGASVLGVLEASEDGSYVYFVARGGLPNTGAIAGNLNLYVWHEGITRLVGVLAEKDDGSTSHEPVVANDWTLSAGQRTARVTADGRHLLFMSAASLTGYDNRDVKRPEVRDEEVYLYDAESNKLTCTSCNPTGARPNGPSGFPGGTPWHTVFELGTYQPRVLSSDGNRVFFDSRDALLPQDTNGAQDVYEWEREGAGTCEHEGGCLSLLSGGISTSESSLVDASATGNDVFFITRASLLAQDTDQLRDLYDARVAGGFPQPGTSSPACEGESCLPSPSSPALLGSLISTTFSGAGNLHPASNPVAKPKAKKPAKGKRPKRRLHKTRHGASGKSARRLRPSVRR